MASGQVPDSHSPRYDQDVDDRQQDEDIIPLDSDEELEALMGLVKIEDEPISKKKDTVTGTGLLYDELMLQHQCEFDEKFPECPDRIRLPYERCKELGLIDRCVNIPTRYATEDQLLLQHTHDLLHTAQATTSYSLDEQKQFSVNCDSVYVNQKSYECALAACGCTIEGVEQIIKEKIRNCFVMVRPPGHHAMEDEFCGYCIFNNVAIATKYALEEFQLQRILIVDWDVHHGQGTQRMFYDDPRVLYFSIHRYEHGEFWPNLRESDYDYIGTGKGQGFNINVPLNKTGMTDSDYLAILQQILLPVAYEFSPQLIIVSSGYDAAIGCPEFAPQLIIVSHGLDAAIGDEKGEMNVSPAAYAHFIHMLNCLADGRVCVVLEGGYCLKSLAEGCALSLRALLGDPCPVLPPTHEPSDSVVESILNVIKVLKPYWTCFIGQDDLEEGEICEYSGTNSLPPIPGVEFSTEKNRPKEFEIMGNYPTQSVEVISRYEQKIADLIAEVNLNKAPHRTCVVFDADMRAHKSIFMKNHPERPDRITSIYNFHVETKLLERCLRVQSREATLEELATIHSIDYINDLKLTREMSDIELRNLQTKFNSIYLCKKSYECALLSAGSVLNVVDTVLSGKSQNGVAIVRPPGHHAESDKCMGFCFFNNVAVAAEYAKQEFGLKRILIVDWDVHHGNGTQHQFYDDPSVLFISLHRFDNGFFYPTSDDGDYFNVGTGDGEGFNINIPWNHNRMGDSEYIAAFHHIIMPIALEFAPELVLISAGFDSAHGDPLGGYKVMPAGYGHMTHMLSQLANGKVVVILEGGYNLNSISVSMATCTSVLLGDTCPNIKPPEPCNSAIETLHNVLDTHKHFWNSLKCRVSIPRIEDLENSLLENKTEKKNTNTMDDKNSTTEANGLNTAQRADDPSSSSVGACGGSSEMSKGACGGSDRPNTVEDLFKMEGQLFAVQPLPWCQHLADVQPLPSPELNCHAPCENCGETEENWVCLICYKVYCSRFRNEHMLFHGIETEHRMVLSYSDLSVWCYACNSYIDNEIVYPMKNAAHKDKFGEEIRS